MLLKLGDFVSHIWQPCEPYGACSEPVPPVSDRGGAFYAGPVAVYKQKWSNIAKRVY